jgi:hypothetical protein
MKLAKGWDRESEDLYIHESGARITKSVYRGKQAWWFFPASLDVPAVEHAPTDEGRDEAFAMAEREMPKTRAKPKPRVVKKAVAAKDEEAEPGTDAEGEGAEADKEDEEVDE